MSLLALKRQSWPTDAARTLALLAGRTNASAPTQAFQNSRDGNLSDMFCGL